MQTKAIVMDENAVERALMRMAHEIVEKNRGTENLILIGIRRRGVPLANMLAHNIQKIDGHTVPVGEIDITLYRDDLSEQLNEPHVAGNHIQTDVTGMNCVLVDDVLYTGRTARAAMDALMDIGRPKLIRLAVLIDRGHRELPVHADFVGKNVPTSQSEVIGVRVPEYDACLDVMLYDTDPGMYSGQGQRVL